MTGIVDKSRSHKSGQAISRQKMIDRNRDLIRKQAADILKNTGIDGLKGKKKITIKANDIPNPPIYSDHGEDKFIIHGNDKYNRGQKIPVPPGQGGGGGSGQGGGGGEDSESVLDLILTQEEFLNILFNGLELPNIEKTFFSLISSEYQRAGYTTTGSPTSLNLLKTMENAIGRKVAAEKRGKTTPYIIEEDLRYNLRQPIETAESRAVIFFIMDVSGSITEKMRYASKIYFMLLHLFVTQMYKVVEVQYIQHAERAHVLNYDDFFNKRIDGGTMIAPAYGKMAEIIQEKYNEPSWNIYVSQTSDGEVITAEDVERAFTILQTKVLPKIRHLSYIEFIVSHGWGDSIKRLSDFYTMARLTKNNKIDVVTLDSIRLENESNSGIAESMLKTFTHIYKKRRETN